MNPGRKTPAIIGIIDRTATNQSVPVRTELVRYVGSPSDMNTMYFFTPLRPEVSLALAALSAASQFVPPSAPRPLTALTMSIALSVKFNTLPAVVEKGDQRHPDVAILALVLRRQQMLRHAVDGSLRNLKTRVVSHRVTHGTGGVEHHDDVGTGDTVVCDEPDCVPVTFRDRS